MSIYNTMRRQTACHWPIEGFDGMGQPMYGPVEELAPPNGVRWQDTQEAFVSATGEQTVSKSKVFVHKPLQLGAVLWLGKLSDLEDWDNPLLNRGASPIRGFKEIPNLKNTKVLRIALL